MKDSECAFIQQLLALRPADWGEEERRRAATHLVTCAECGRLAHLYAVQDRALQALPTAGLDPAARQRLLARLAPERRSGASRPQTTWVLGTVALVVAVLVASLLLWQSNLLQGVAESTPAIEPTQVLTPSPTITPTTALAPTPMGEAPPAPVVGRATPYTPMVDLWNGPQPTALYGAPARTEEAAGP